VDHPKNAKTVQINVLAPGKVSVLRFMAYRKLNESTASSHPSGHGDKGLTWQ